MLIPVSDHIIEFAVDLTGRHPLHGYDAVHLATAVMLNRALQEADAPPLTFVAADTRLCDAAGRKDYCRWTRTNIERGGTRTP